MFKVTDTKEAPAAIGPYCQAVSINGLLITSGQIPLDAVTGEVVGKTVEEQTEQVIKNLAAVLKANGVDFNKVIKTTCFLSDMANFAKFNEVYAKHFISKPARSCVAVKELPKSVLVEIELIADLG